MSRRGKQKTVEQPTPKQKESTGFYLDLLNEIALTLAKKETESKN